MGLICFSCSNQSGSINMSKAYIENNFIVIFPLLLPEVGIEGFLWQFGNFDAPMNVSPNPLDIISRAHQGTNPMKSSENRRFQTSCPPSIRPIRFLHKQLSLLTLDWCHCSAAMLCSALNCVRGQSGVKRSLKQSSLLFLGMRRSCVLLWLVRPYSDFVKIFPIGAFQDERLKFQTWNLGKAAACFNAYQGQSLAVRGKMLLCIFFGGVGGCEWLPSH